MRNEEHSTLAGDAPADRTSTRPGRRTPPGQRVRGIAGRLRPYRDVRAGFEPWRRAALEAWAVREDVLTVH